MGIPEQMEEGGEEEEMGRTESACVLQAQVLLTEEASAELEGEGGLEGPEDFSQTCNPVRLAETVETVGTVALVDKEAMVYTIHPVDQGIQVTQALQGLMEELVGLPAG